MAWRGLLGLASLHAARATALAEPRLGFIGVGTIASAVVRGLCADAKEPPPSILLSPRSEKCAGALAAEFAGRVSMASDNQAVVDGCDVLFLSVLPQQVTSLLTRAAPATTEMPAELTVCSHSH
jgi:pyrroline-5-carboxylate reductase